MSLLNESKNKEIYSIPTACGEYRYVFSQHGDTCTAKGLPRGVDHSLVNCKTGATLVSGRIFFCSPSWEQNDLIKRMLVELCEVSARMFFKTVARKPELWDAWKKRDHQALREKCLRYVLVEEAIDGFFTNVMKTERLRRPLEDTKNYVIAVKSSEHFRGQFGGHNFSVTRVLEFHVRPGKTPAVNVTYELRLPYQTADDFNFPGRMSIKYKYPLQSWPTFKHFVNEPRVESVLKAWINSWPDEVRKESLEKTAF